MRERFFSQGVKTRLSFPVIFGCFFDFRLSLRLTRKTGGTKGYWSGLDDSGVHQVGGGIGEVDGDASFPGYDCQSWVALEGDDFHWLEKSFGVFG